MLSNKEVSNIDKLERLFPECITEYQDAMGILRRGVDFDKLKLMLTGLICEGSVEKFELNWPGKQAAILEAGRPSKKKIAQCESDDLDPETHANIFIEGDCLDVLKILQSSHIKKIKLIYLDPPYNTGRVLSHNDQFATSISKYPTCNPIELQGRFHSAWLSFMYPRLKLAHNLLQDDGVILISIDENELSNLWRICDEIFGRQNFVECLVYDKKAAAKGVPPANMIAGVHEYILCYQKSERFAFLGTPRNPDDFHNPDNDPRGPWRNTNCKSTVKATSTAFSITDPLTGRSFKDTWAHSFDEMNRMAAEGILIFPSKSSGQVRKKEYLNGFRNVNKPIKSSLGLYDAQTSTQELTRLMGGKYFLNPKSLRLMTDLISFSTSKNDLILDLFAGSASTAHAIFCANAKDGGNRKFILVQSSEPFPPNSNAYKAGYSRIAKLSKDRINRAGLQMLSGKKHSDWKLDVGFQEMFIIE